MADTQQESDGLTVSKMAGLIFVFAFGAFFVFAGLTTISSREWPIFMPAQFDVWS